ncbi:MAG: exopolysaccharide Pel transporter PelG [Gammaproteobacteria bacterium]|nr:exopolysaccharide Pel transporter PelG [Gammaproteobacteria bacterium]
MAGIGFELRRLLRHDNYTGLLQAYAYAGLISAGPWIISILGVLFLGIISLGHVSPDIFVSQFQTSLTYLISSSLIFTGIFQLSFTRYVADRLFARETARILPNLNGLLMLVMGLGGALAIGAAHWFFAGQGLAYQLLMIGSFSVLCGIWTVAVMLTGLKRYAAIVGIFLFGYGVTFVAGVLLRPFALVGLLSAFFLGQFLLFMAMLTLIYREYPSARFAAFDFLRGSRCYPSLVVSGFLYNAAIWADKYIFWFEPATSEPIIGPLRGSVIYDLPIFLAYLSILPGMAVFLMRMETDFVEYYDRFYAAVREGGTLSHIRTLRNKMVASARSGIFDIIKVQSLAALLAFVLGGPTLKLLHISPLYGPLFNVDVVGASLQVVLLGVLNVFFYLDKRYRAVLVTAAFFILNILLTLLSIRLGVFYYGYGLVLSLLLSVVLGLILLDRDMDQLEYQTFMLQK